MTKTRKPVLSAFILLDRSSSMSGPKWENAIASINQYVDGLIKNGAKGNVTLASFAGTSGLFGYAGIRSPGVPAFGKVEATVTNSFTVHRDKVALKNWERVESYIAQPNGSTPLYDATAELLNMAETNAAERTVIIIMTDGEENTSREYTLTAIRDRVKSVTTRGWEVVFLGAEFNADQVAADYGLMKSKVINTSFRGLTAGMDYMADASIMYASASAGDIKTGAAAIDTLSVKDDLAKI